MYLRMKREEMPAVQGILSRMPGDIPVYINLPEENITLLCPRTMWVKDAQTARQALAGRVSEENMRVVQK